MLSPKQLESLPQDILPAVQQLEDDILESMAARIAQEDFAADALTWESQKAQDLRMTRDEIIKKLSRKSGILEKEVSRILNEAAQESLAFDTALYSLAGDNPLPIIRSPAFMQLLRAGIANTGGVVFNFTQTTANTATGHFERILDRAYMQVLSGFRSTAKATADAVDALGRDGVRLIQYPTGHVDTIEVAALRAVRTGIAQTSGTLQLHLAQELEQDLMQITAHLGARPSHATWQGKVVSLSGAAGYLSTGDIGYGTGAGFKGWNCRHDWYPYIKGISLEPETFDIEENNEVYEATQKQRAMERAVRQSKRQCIADKAALDAATDPATKEAIQRKMERHAVQLKERRNTLNSFLEEYTSPTGGKLQKQTYRERVYSFDRSMAAKMRELNKKVIRENSQDLAKMYQAKGMDSYRTAKGNFSLSQAKKDYETFLQSVPEKNRIWLQAAYEGTTYRRTKLNGTAFGYSKMRDVIVYDPSQRGFWNIPFATANTHELAHRVDAFFVHSEQNAAWSAAIRNAAAVIDRDPQWFMAYSESLDKTGYISDIFSVISGGRYKFKYNHDAKYINEPHVKEREVFANLFAMEAYQDDQSLAAVGKQFPEIMKLYEAFKYAI